MYLIITGLLIYVVWKKIRAVPNYQSINVSLIVWSAVFIFSIAVLYISNWSGEYYIWPILVLPKLVTTVIQKREIRQWKHRIFKRKVNFLSGFWDNTSESLRKMLRTSIWVLSVLLIISISTSVPYIIHLTKEYDKLNKKYETLDKLFNRLHELLNTQTNIANSDRNFIFKQRAEYLRESFYIGKPNRFSKGTVIGGWTSREHYFDYAICQYMLGRPEGCLEGINYCINNKTMDKYPQTFIKAAFNLGLFDECRKLLEIARKTSEWCMICEFDKETIRFALKVGLFDLVKEILDRRGNVENALVIYKAHALLMTGEREKALTIYRQQINNTSFDGKNEIEKDFSIFRWLGFPDREISLIEKELNLHRINVYTQPDDEKNTALAAPFFGNWQFEENNRRINLEIRKDNFNLCYYLFQSKRNDRSDWVDERAISHRYRMKQMDNKTIMEEFNIRGNVLFVSEIALINADELQVRAMDSGEVKIYRRVK